MTRVDNDPIINVFSHSCEEMMKTKLLQSQVLRRALSDEHQALLCLKLCSDMEEVREDISTQLPRNYCCIILSPNIYAPVSTSCEMSK